MRNAGEFMRKRGRSAYAGEGGGRSSPGRPAGFLRSRARGRVRRRSRLTRFGTRRRRVPFRRGKPRRAGAGLHRFRGLHVLCPSPAPSPVPRSLRGDFRLRRANSGGASKTSGFAEQIPRFPRSENSRRAVLASLTYAAFRRISGISRSIFVIKMPYPVVGSLMSTWVTAPTNLPS